MPKISVLMPVYRTNEDFLRQAIESILRQSFADFEFLIVDDCPEDDREDIIKSYTDPRIRYYKNERNLGIAESRNRLIDMARGEYLAVVDHDDVSLPERFARQIAYLDAHPETGVVGTKLKTIIRKRVSSNPTEDRDIKMALMRTCAVSHQTAMIRKSVLDEHNIRYEKEFSPAEDYCLFCRLISHTGFYNINDEILLYYRDHATNTSHTQFDKMQQATLAVWAFVKAQHPVLYNEFLLKAKHTTFVRLFGFIPLLTVVTKANQTKIYLLSFILLCRLKSVIKIKEVS